MDAEWAYSLSLFRADNSPLTQLAIPASAFWPAKAWANFIAARWQGCTDTPAGDLLLEPRWNALGAPYLNGFAVVLPALGIAIPFGNDYFNTLATESSSALIRAGQLCAGESILYLPQAHAPTESARSAACRMAPIPFTSQPGSIDAWRSQSTCCAPHLAAPFPAFVFHDVLATAAALCEQAGDVEVGGVLLGQLVRDPLAQEIALLVTDLIPAAGGVSGKSSFTFTAESWRQVGQACADRPDRLLVGWFHFHPFGCFAEQRPALTPTVGFSAHDLYLHREVFGATAYAVALLFSQTEQASTDFTVTLGGWQHSAFLAERDFYLINDIPAALEVCTNAIAAEEQAHVDNFVL